MAQNVVAFIMIVFMALFIIVNAGVITFLSLRRLMFVNLIMYLRKARRRIKIEVEPLDDHTVNMSLGESEESKVHSLDDENVAMSR